MISTSPICIYHISLQVNGLQSNLDFGTSPSSNNSVFEQKIRDENYSVLEQKFGYRTKPLCEYCHCDRAEFYLICSFDPFQSPRPPVLNIDLVAISESLRLVA